MYVVTNILEMELQLVIMTGKDGFSLSMASKPLIDTLKDWKGALLKNITYIDLTHLSSH
jgi:hypothetical protein